MKKSVLHLCFALLVACAAVAARAADSQAESPARITLTVTQFRPVTGGTGETRWTDANITMLPHRAVRLEGDGGSAALAKFRVRRAANFQIEVVSANPGERYKALGVMFEQKFVAEGKASDAHGQLNFEAGAANGSTISFKVRHDPRCTGNRYEFFVVVQNVTTGEIGIIDPEVENEEQPQ